VVLLHDNGGMVGDWEACGVVDRLAKRHRVIAFDQPGFGHTAHAPGRIWSPGAQASLFTEAMRQLDVRNAVVVGHSSGVLPALALAADHRDPVSELVLMSGVYYPELRSDIITSLASSLPVIGNLLCYTLTPLVAAATSQMQTKTIFDPAPVAGAFRGFPMDMSLRPSQMRTQVKETVMLPVVTAALASRYAS
jgi:pimeloyl-ACP methyl ester carboxylesterase